MAQLRQDIAAVESDMSEALNANAKLCPVCERVQILKTADLCQSCGSQAAEEARRNQNAVELWLRRQAGFDKWCAEHGLPDPHTKD